MPFFKFRYMTNNLWLSYTFNNMFIGGAKEEGTAKIFKFNFIFNLSCTEG